MNNRGMAIGTKVILVIILLLIVFIAVAGSFGFGFKKVFDQAKQLLGFPSAQLEELKEATKPPPEIKEGEKETERLLQLLADAANHIKNKEYDEAIKKYALYYDGCEKPKPGTGCKPWVGCSCGGIKKEGVKFRILNALREKYFVNPGHRVDQNDVKIVSIGLITQKEFSCTVALIRVVAYAHLDKRDEFIKSSKSYRGLDYCSRDEYYSYLTSYSNLYVVIGQESCKRVLESSNGLISLTNIKLEAFETATGGYKDKVKVDFDAARDYEFLRVPHEYIEKTC